MNKQEIGKAIETLKKYHDLLLEVYADYSVYSKAENYSDKSLELASRANTVKNAVGTAITHMSQQLNNGWIPVSERLPEDIGWYRTTDISLGKKHPMVCTGWWNGSKFIDFLDEKRECSFDLNFVTAWKGEEEPYKEAL